MTYVEDQFDSSRRKLNRDSSEENFSPTERKWIQRERGCDPFFEDNDWKQNRQCHAPDESESCCARYRKSRGHMKPEKFDSLMVPLALKLS